MKVGAYVISTANTLPCKHNNKGEQVKSRLLLVTPTGVRHELEASNSEDRDSWASHIRATSKLC